MAIDAGDPDAIGSEMLQSTSRVRPFESVITASKENFSSSIYRLNCGKYCHDAARSTKVPASRSFNACARASFALIRSHKAISSSTLATMRCCSARGGSGKQRLSTSPTRRCLTVEPIASVDARSSKLGSVSASRRYLVLMYSLIGRISMILWPRACYELPAAAITAAALGSMRMAKTTKCKLAST